MFLRILSPVVHGALDYLLAIAFLLAPQVLAFEHDAARVAQIIGVTYLGVSLLTRYPLGLVKWIPFPVHGVAAYRVSGGSPITGTTARLRGASSSRCLDVENGSTAAGANTVIQDCHTAASQQWTTWPNGEIRVLGDKCLDAYNQGTVAGTRVITWSCNGQPNQRWTVAADGSVRNAGLCLDVERSGTANGSRLVLWTCNGQPNQRWSRS